WAGVIANMADIKVQILPGKGSMIAVNHRVVNTVINRCKMPADGDILVPAHTVAVMGTTDIKVPDANQFGIEPWEIQLMLTEGEKIVPGFSKFRILRAWAGVRPLFQETTAAQNRDVTRAFVLLDHYERDQVESFLTITSGKWTTYRKMAEVTVDKACQKLGVQRACRTHQEPLPMPEKHSTHNYHRLGERLHHIEQAKAFDQLVCECELATRSDVEKAITLHNSQTLDDIRRDVRLGMGPCQGGFCSYRAAGLLHELRHPEVEKTNASLRDFLQERWKGMHPILWGQQLRQSRLNELIYLNVLNVEHLPGPISTRLASEPYTPPTLPGNKENAQRLDDPNPSIIVSLPQTFTGAPLDVLVIGAGLAGLVAGWHACKLGKKTRLISKGFGATHWSAGCIDVLGYLPGQTDQPLNSPKEGLSSLIASNPAHPYALLSIEQIDSALTQFQSILAQAGYPMEGSLDQNWLLPTALGAIRPTCLAPKTMIAGDVRTHQPMLIVGFAQYQDFYARLVADNLNAQDIIARDITIALPELRNQRIFSSMSLARLFDTPEFRRSAVQAILPRLGNAKRIGFPAVLGLHYPLEVIHDLQEMLGVPVFEIPGLPPSVPGIRLHNLLVQAIQALGGQVYSGVECVAATVVDQEVRSVISEAAARRKPHIAKNYILATGGFLGGGFNTRENDYAQETIFGLQLASLSSRHEWFMPEFFTPTGQPFFRKGILVSRHFTPLDSQGLSILKNLAVVGGALDGFDPLREHSLEGVALTSGYWSIANLRETANA
ncbi:MAG TPA: glycerol-3-phosphate dehydrogenase subunit GlpB, partial [Anaerolineales bacterium]|nr:glycerol-3-phosphate dehydrogenase subunit GlpB [Anaerolineales bacterium]